MEFAFEHPKNRNCGKRKKRWGIRALALALLIAFCLSCTGMAFADGTWYCPECGRQNDSNFCPADGTAKPADLDRPAASQIPAAVTKTVIETFDEVNSWTGIRALFETEVWTDDFGVNLLFGLQYDGSLCIAADSWKLSEAEAFLDELSGWNHVKQIVSSMGFPIALREDGEVLVPSSLYAQEGLKVYSENLSGIRTLIPVQNYASFYGEAGILGIRENGKAVWITAKGQEEYAPEKDGVEPTEKLMRLLGSSEPTAVYYNYQSSEGRTGFTALTAEGTILSTEYPELNGRSGVEAIYPVMFFNGDAGLIALLSDGSTLAAGLHNSSDYEGTAEINRAYDAMKQEISSWRNVRDICIRFEDGQVLAILADGSMTQVAYETVFSQVNPGYNWIAGLDVSDVRNAAFFTKVCYGLTVLQDGTIATERYANPDYGYTISYPVPAGFRVRSVTGGGTYYALSEDGRVCSFEISY